MYDSIPRSVIITLGSRLYRMPDVVSPTTIYLICTKKCIKVISKTEKFVLFVIHAHSNQKVITTPMASTQSLYLHHKQMEKYKEIFLSPTEVLMHCQVKHPIDMTLGAPLPHGSFYHHSLMENDEIRC
jgi:hypothetical protein